jgi:anaerobic dimethyl sulfoxide reductase subunit C (anchor subunit)
MALKGEGKEIQLPSLIVSLVALAIGGISVLFHLAQPLHIFNGFGNPTSGITQELVCIVIYVIVMLVYFIMLRRNDNQVPSWCAILAIAISVILVIVCSHSYMMASRPAWDTVLQIVSIIGGACAAGPGFVALIAGAKKCESKTAAMVVFVGAVIGLVTTLVYIFSLSTTGSNVTTMGTYIDPTNPTAAVFDGSSASPFVGSALCPTIIAIVASIAAACTGFATKKTGNLKVWGTLTAVLGLVAMIALRVTFYMLGVSIYNFYGITG